MDIAEYKALVAEEGCRLEAGSEVGRLMDEAAYAAQRVTARINNEFHTQEELCELFSELTGRAVDKSFKLFPPFYTDFGKNIKVGRNVFINSGCCFQDQGGIEIGDGTLIGHQVVIATLNHDPDPEKRGRRESVDRLSRDPAPRRYGRGGRDSRGGRGRDSRCAAALGRGGRSRARHKEHMTPLQIAAGRSIIAV